MGPARDADFGHGGGGAPGGFDVDFGAVFAFAEERFVHGGARVGQDRVLEVGAVGFEVFFAAAGEGGVVGSGGG